MEEIENPKDKLLTELEEVLVEALFEPQQVKAIVDTHRTLDVDAIQKSIDEYRAHAKNIGEVLESKKAREAEIAKGVDQFEIEVIDAVNAILREEVERDGNTYTPIPYKGKRDFGNDDA